jgi:hypothetical protein
MCFESAKLLTDEKTFPKWECEKCERAFSLSEVQCDHKNPVSNTVPQNQEEFLESFKRLHSDELQILCKSCHHFKTKEDNFNKKYFETLNRVNLYLFGKHDKIVLDEWATLQKLDKLIAKIERADENKKPALLKNLDKLKEKYL